jgi:uncharacterized protein (DUF983 family)
VADQNPYAPPSAQLDPPKPSDVSQDTCPKCKSNAVHRPGFTWWGGAVGPRLLSHAVCKACGYSYNWKTGQSNNGPIAIYIVIVSVIAIGIGIALSTR